MNQAETTGRDKEPRGLDVTMSSARDLVVANATEEAWGFPDYLLPQGRIRSQMT